MDYCCSRLVTISSRSKGSAIRGATEWNSPQAAMPSDYLFTGRRVIRQILVGTKIFSFNNSFYKLMAKQCKLIWTQGTEDRGPGGEYCRSSGPFGAVITGRVLSWLVWYGEPVESPGREGGGGRYWRPVVCWYGPGRSADRQSDVTPVDSPVTRWNSGTRLVRSCVWFSPEDSLDPHRAWGGDTRVYFHPYLVLIKAFNDLSEYLLF